MRSRVVWLMAAVVIGFVASGPSQAQRVPNLLTNGGFETGAVSPWGTYSSAVAVVTTQVVTTCAGATVPEKPIEGKYCLDVKVSARGVNNWDAGLQYRNMTFQKGKKYTLSVFLKCKTGTLQINFKPEQGQDPWTGYGQKTFTMTDKWAEYRITTPVFVADVTPAVITFHIGFAGTEFWIDDVKWYEGDYVAQAKYSGGSGTMRGPYQIATAADLILLGDSPSDYDKQFILTADIDLDPKLPGRKVFDKVLIAPDTDTNKDGFQGTAFTGVFDGSGHTISHLTITGKDYVGLFGSLASGAEVRNLGLIDVNLAGSGDWAGALAAYNDGTVTCSYSTGSVSGAGWVGGLVGHNAKTVNNCYSGSAATAKGLNVGGLVGTNSGTVACCYSTGSVRGGGAVGGLVGLNSGAVAQCFWDTQTSSQTTSAAGTGRATAQMQTAATFLTWGICRNDGIWGINEGHDYPRLRWENKEVSYTRLSEFLEGEGTAVRPYVISTLKDLDTIAKFPCEQDKRFRKSSAIV